jgi:signal transduction histidine kinase/ActR/RegA family two-component response regulator
MPKSAKAVEILLAQRLKYEQGLALCSKALLMTGIDFNSAVNKALGALLEATEVSRVYIFENEEDAQLGMCMNQTFEACASGISPEIDNPDLQHLPYSVGAPRWPEFFVRGEPVGGLVESFPPEERESLEPQGIISLLAIPINVSGNWFGFIGFDDNVNRREWSEDDVRLQRTAAEMIGAFFERNRAAEALKHQHDQLLSIFDSIDEPIYVSDIDSYEILFANNFLCNAIGKELVGKICYEELQGFDKPCEFCTNCKLKTNGGNTFQWEHSNPITNKDYLLYDRIIRWPDGRDVRFEQAIDITERVKLKEEQDKAAKLESIGILAGGIAHDFNNILTAILGNISLAGISFESNPGASAKLLAEAEKACFSAKSLTQQLLTFSKGGQPTIHSTEMKELITDSVSFALRGSSAGRIFGIADNLWQGNVDSGQVTQVINNMVINADHAMPDGGNIIVNAENVVVEPCDKLSLEPGNYIRIDIIDSGHGIPAKYITKIFDPYFSTKQHGHGLGLSTCYSIVKRHRGLITVDSSQKAGTAFHVYFPAAPLEPADSIKEQSELLPEKARVLVMDDEDMIRNMIRKYLTRMGHEVDDAFNGQKALELFRKNMQEGTPYEVVILDLTVPGGMGGKEAFEAMRELDADIRGIISSGYSNDPVMTNYREYGFSGVVTKPFQLNDLTVALRNALRRDS